MKTKIYIRISRGNKSIKVSAANKPNYSPFVEKNYRGEKYYPTVAFAVDLDIPDELFKTAEKSIAEIVVGLKKANIAAEVAIPGNIKK